ncbi:MAG TPA: BON domain-containing protein [Chloroflexota bacterium]|nr:BON domain-containing protein [Chloroflexota bacterium]
MMPNGYGPANTGNAGCYGNFMPGTFTSGEFGPNVGMGFQGGFGPGMGFQNFGQPGFGMPFQGNFGPGMGFQGGFQPGFGQFYPGTFQPGFNMGPGMGPGFAGGFQPGFGMGMGPVVEESDVMTEMVPPTFQPGPMQMGWGLGGGRRWGGTYTPQYLTTGLPTDSEIVEMVYDSIDNDPLIPFDADINVDSDAGTVTLTGTVMTKQIKHAAGDDSWWIPGVNDVCNELNVERRHPAHAAHEQGTEFRRGTRGTGETETREQPSESTQTPRATRRGVTRR